MIPREAQMTTITITDNWLPTSENINALPRPVRDYIMRLHANTDPAGEIRRAMIAEMERDALRKMMEWQPIESAPEDGTWVLLAGGRTSEDYYLPDHADESRRCAVGAWYEEPGWGGCWKIGFWDGAWRTEYEEPTHWMPLPEVPSERG